MTKQRQTKQKQVKYCVCCGKIVNGHDVIRADHSVDFVKKQGYDVTYTSFIWEEDKRYKKGILAGILILFSFMFLPLASAQTFTGGLSIDFAQNINIVLLVLSFLFCGVLFYFRLYSFVALILLVDGFLMLMNGVNVFLALIPLISSLIIAGLGGGK